MASSKTTASDAKVQIKQIQDSLKEQTNKLSEAEKKPKQAGLVEGITKALTDIETALSDLRKVADASLQGQLGFLQVELDSAKTRLEDLTIDSSVPRA